MKIVKDSPQCAVAYVETSMGRRLLVARKEPGSTLLRDPVTVATNKVELDRFVRVIMSMRDELPDA